MTCQGLDEVEKGRGVMVVAGPGGKGILGEGCFDRESDK